MKRFARESAVGQLFPNISARPTSQSPRILALVMTFDFFFLYSENIYEFLHLGKYKALSKRGYNYSKKTSLLSIIRKDT